MSNIDLQQRVAEEARQRREEQQQRIAEQIKRTEQKRQAEQRKELAARRAARRRTLPTDPIEAQRVISQRAKRAESRIEAPLAVLNKFLLADVTVKTSNAVETKRLQQLQIKRVQDQFNDLFEQKDQFTPESFNEYSTSVKTYLTEAVKNVKDIDKAIKTGQISKAQLKINVRQLERASLADPDVLISRITKTVKVTPLISKQPELSLLGKISEAFEAPFRKINNLLDKSVKNSKNAAVKAKATGNPVGTITNFSLSTAISGVKGAFNAVTFVVRPVQWKNTSTAVSMFLTPKEGESQTAYESRVNAFVKGDIRDPKEQKKFVAELLKILPSPPSGITKEQREAAAIYRAAVVEVILSDPIKFMAETAGGLAGGYVAGKIVAKLPSAIRKITPKSLERKAFEKLKPLSSIDDATGIQDALGKNPSKLLPTGKWSKINHWIPKERRGTTSLIVLVDPVSKLIKGVITLKEANEMTGGIPELLTSVGGLQAIPIIKINENASQDAVSQLNKLHNQKQVLIPKSVLKNINQNDELLEILIAQGIIVLPDLKEEIISDTSLIQRLDTITIQEEATLQEQDEALDIPLLSVSLLEEPQLTPPPTFKKGDKDKRLKINLRLFRGKKSMFRVTFFFTKSETEVKNVEARSFVEATQKAQRQRKTRKKQPRLIDVVRLT